MLYVPCAAITLWINISVKRHKRHHKINPINIIFLGFFFSCGGSWEVGKRQIEKKRLNRSEFLYKITTEKRDFDCIQRNSNGNAFIVCNTGTCEPITSLAHTYFAHFTISTQKFVPFHWISLQSELLIRTSKNFPTEKEGVQVNFSNNTHDIPNSTEIRIFVLYCTLTQYTHIALFTYWNSCIHTYLCDAENVNFYRFIYFCVAISTRWTKKKTRANTLTFDILPTNCCHFSSVHWMKCSCVHFKLLWVYGYRAIVASFDVHFGNFEHISANSYRPPSHYEMAKL